MRTFLRPSHPGEAVPTNAPVDRPVVEQPVVAPVVNEPPVYQQPVAQQPVVAQPVVEQPVYQQPLTQTVVQQPVVAAPVAVAETDNVARRDVVVDEGTNRVPSAFLAALAGAALVVVGLVVLARAGIDDTWRDPVVRIAGMNHTPLMGAIDVGAGVILLLSAMTGATFRFVVGVLLAIAGAVLWIEPNSLRDDLAAPWGFGAIAVCVGVVIALLAFIEGNRRSVLRHTVADRAADTW
jgi:hypothetical protein